MKQQLIAIAALFGATLAHGERAQDQWDVFGSFGKARGEAKATANGFAFDGKGYTIATVVETDRHGVSLRKTVVKNVSAKPVTVNCLMDRFMFPGGDYEIYTQANSWENESRGAWQPLHTGVSARGFHTCGSNGAAPMMAIWDAQAGRGQVYHLLSDGAWEINAYRYPQGGDNTGVAIDMGVDSRHLSFELKPGEEVALPEVVTYEFRNRLDLDCHKLHAFWNEKFPAKRPQPTIYNSWLCRFDKLETDFVLKQVERAKRVGADYFVLDAGWFGPKAGWTSVRGDWEESPDGYLGGRMADVSKAVRAAGMKFGFWVEAESASPRSKAVKAHPDWFIAQDGQYFLDFTNPAAFNYLAETVCALLKKYDASFLKFDFNQNVDYDATGRSFVAYNAAYRAFIREIRRRNPGIYIQGCASGGLMMNLGWARDFDSFWLSDNQSPYHGIRIIKETMLRLPPRMIERWVVARTLRNVQPDYVGKDSRLIACDDACWFRMRSVLPSYFDAFTLAGPTGFSCDLTAFADADLARFADVLTARRGDSAFWNNAVGRLLCDTPSVVAIQYDDLKLDDIRIAVVPDIVRQSHAVIHPVVDPAADYLVDGKRRSAADLAANGIAVPTRNYNAVFVRLQRVGK